MKLYGLLAALVLVMGSNAHGQETPELQIQMQAAIRGGEIKVRLYNKTFHDIYIWQYRSNSWGWGIWTFEFLKGNKLQVFVRQPRQSFGMNIASSETVPKVGFLDLTFDLNDGSWVSTSVSIFPAYPRDEDDKNSIKGCFAILSIPNSEESKNWHIWKGTSISSLYPYDEK